MIITGRRKITKYLNLSWPTVLRLYRDQGLPLVQVGRKWGLETEAIKEWMEKEYERQHNKIHTA